MCISPHWTSDPIEFKSAAIVKTVTVIIAIRAIR